MTDKLDEGDVIDVKIINEVASKARDMRIKPINLGGVDYYLWFHNKEGGLVPVGGSHQEAPGSPISPNT